MFSINYFYYFYQFPVIKWNIPQQCQLHDNAITSMKYIETQKPTLSVRFSTNFSISEPIKTKFGRNIQYGPRKFLHYNVITCMIGREAGQDGCHSSPQDQHNIIFAVVNHPAGVCYPGPPPGTNYAIMTSITHTVMNDTITIASVTKENYTTER